MSFGVVKRKYVVPGTRPGMTNEGFAAKPTKQVARVN
jgi:hypothetical protein